MTITESPKERLVELLSQKLKEAAADSIRSVAEGIADMSDDEIVDLILSISRNLTPGTQQEVLEVLKKAAQEYVAGNEPVPGVSGETSDTTVLASSEGPETVAVSSEDKDIPAVIDDLPPEKKWMEAIDIEHEETYTCPDCGHEERSLGDFTMVNYEGGSSGRRVWMCPECHTLLK